MYTINLCNLHDDTTSINCVCNEIATICICLIHYKLQSFISESVRKLIEFPSLD